MQLTAHCHKQISSDPQIWSEFCSIQCLLLDELLPQCCLSFCLSAVYATPFSYKQIYKTTMQISSKYLKVQFVFQLNRKQPELMNK